MTACDCRLTIWAVCSLFSVRRELEYLVAVFIESCSIGRFENHLAVTSEVGMRFESAVRSHQ